MHQSLWECPSAATVCGNSAAVSGYLQNGINVTHCAGSLWTCLEETGLSERLYTLHNFRLTTRLADVRRALPSILLLALAAAVTHNAHAGEAPLVALSTVDSSIRQDMRYASEKNFTGRRVPGYEAAECWLRPAAARALAKVQADLIAAHPDLSLKVFDCYRPRRSVQAFVAWAGGAENDGTENYYPNVSRGSLLARGYIGRTSNHSKGLAVDLTLVHRAGNAVEPSQQQTVKNKSEELSVACTQTSDRAFDASSIDMGTTFDCFDRKSHTDAAGLTREQRASRQLLVRFMKRHGFQNYSKEWWHFTYGGGDDGRTFDVPVREPPHHVPQPSGSQPR